jgi:NRAMP (natural resistance-associated macrophage protein)-like metal ion transporter
MEQQLHSSARPASVRPGFPVLPRALLFARRATQPAFERSREGIRLFRDWRKRRLGLLARPLAFLGVLGPGLIAANAGNDAGAVTTWAQVGAQYGYALLWVLVVITISLSVVQEMCARMGAATGQGLSDLIRERFGVRGASFAMFTLLIANILVTISEFAGIAAASELFGVPRYVSVPVAALGIWFVITRGSYERVEKVFLVMSFAFFTYPIAAVLAHPDWHAVAYHAVVPTFQLNSTYLLLLVGTIGTTITPYMQVFIQSSVAEKGVTMEHYRAERTETYLGSIFAALVVASILIATAATVYVASGGQGVEITDAKQAALALEPFLGEYATLLFAVGLIGASLLAAAVLPLSTAYAISEAFGFERGVSHTLREAPIFNGLFTGILALGALVALIPGLPLIRLILFAQVINGALLPIMLFFIIKLVNDRRLMGKHVNRPVENLIAWATAFLLTALSALMLASVLLPMVGIHLPFLQ